MGALNFNGAGGGWTLQDNLTVNSSSSVTLTAGTLNDNGKAVSVPNFLSSNSNTRALTISGSWTGFQSGQPWDITNSSGMTLTATGSTLTFTNAIYFQGGGLTYGTVVLPQRNPIVYGANTFANLSYTGYSNLIDTITFAANQTVTGTLTINGNSVINRIFINSDVKGTPRTLTTATNSISNADVQDITGAGASGWNLSAITGKSGDCGGCSGITFTTPINCYQVQSSGAYWSASNWYTTSGGATPARVPLPQDTAIIDANSSATSPSITIDMPRISAMNWTGANLPTLSCPAAYSLFGSLTFVAGMTQLGSVTVTFENRGSINLDGGGVTWSYGPIVQNGPGGTVNLTSNFHNSSNLNVTGGTWSNGSHTLTVASLIVDGGTFNLGSGGLTCSNGVSVSAGTLEMNGNNIVLPHGALGAATVTISGGVLNLSGQIGVDSATITVSGGTINDTGSAGELVGNSASFTGGTSVVRKLTLDTGSFAQSSTSSLTITGSATWGGNWNMSGTTFTFTTPGVPTWSAGTLTIVPPGGSGGGSWTFC
jgi:hypothetical protein